MLKKKKWQNNSKLKIYALNLRFQAIVFLFLPNQNYKKATTQSYLHSSL